MIRKLIDMFEEDVKNHGFLAAFLGWSLIVLLVISTFMVTVDYILHSWS